MAKLGGAPLRLGEEALWGEADRSKSAIKAKKAIKTPVVALFRTLRAEKMLSLQPGK